MELYLGKHIDKRTKNGCFAKGNIPVNKATIGVMKQNKTSFKKGELPHNTKPVGFISLRKHKRGEQYYYIKNSNNKFVLYHRFLWEEKYGEIPKGFILVFRDKNSLNYEIENLELITRRENLKRNINRRKMAENRIKNNRIKQLRKLYEL